ncbi:hypothetical protein [Halorubrum trapanicum]|uniref:hypothetical protein n=1 Tax=Halorubrum trapanicum TaxID=29284 RepID=UPI003C6F8BD1
MPTKQRVRSAIVEITEALTSIGYETNDLIGPVNEKGEQIPEGEVEETDEVVQYYLTGETSRSNFYLRFSLDQQYAVAVYPMNVLRHLGSYLDRDEAEAIIDEPLDWAEMNEQEEDMMIQTAAERVVENTDPANFHQAAFNLSAYASTSLVDYRQTTTDDGFPKEMQCVRGIFPYTEHITLEQIDSRIHPVIVAGERGRRYIEYSFRIDKENKSPEDYEFKALI